MARYGNWYENYGGWAPYVPVAKRREQAEAKIASLKKKGKTINPIQIEGRTLAKTFWGKAWCENLEAYSDFENRLPRGRTYVRNGSVIDLQIKEGGIEALVSGSSIYSVQINIHKLEKNRWTTLIERCAGKIDSLVELLQGRFSQGVMEIITSKSHGLFPNPDQISMDCSCPDGAYMCKHIAAVLYGVGARLDENPELFFKLRSVDHSELITAASTASTVTTTAQTEKVLESTDLSGLFGIELDEEPNNNTKIMDKPRPEIKKELKVKEKEKNKNKDKGKNKGKGKKKIKSETKNKNGNKLKTKVKIKAKFKAGKKNQKSRDQ